MPERPTADSSDGAQPDINPARVAADPLLRRLAAMVAYMDLHIGRYEVSQMTTAQKELWADLVDADSALDALDDPSLAQPSGTPARTPRWWRETYDGPTGPEDPRWSDANHTEPDPFLYVADGGTREPEPDTFEPPDDGPLHVARSALLDVQPGDPYWVWRHEDFAAVYEWAKRSVRPLRRTDGQVGVLRVYPSPNQARTYLDGYRAARAARWETQENS